MDTDIVKSAPGNLFFSEAQMSYLGVDLHTNSFTVCRRTKQGKETVNEYSIVRISDFLRTLRKDDLLAVEATGNTAWFI